MLGFTAAEMALAAFAACNGLRAVAYLPQVAAVWRDANGASAVSFTTWGLFAISNLSTVGYAVLCIDDWRMAAIFSANALCCAVILGLTALKRARHRAALRPAGRGA